ncbi:hypothetical protein Ddye_013811 [Dipteronia dyeriana]|uniref:TIR domain-containing protein n=1 Tax=Dipteronia dyeriana TaxID=168575 RepID=A0AAD9X6V4_9ROSI|nr:hypothetical protein Ddye_013811 [Dipteronia dyeriana]
MALSLIPSSDTYQFNYDVFLSFRGKDTRNKFTSHLHKALLDKQIKTFIDYELNRGVEISPSLLKAIEESQVSIIIFSQHYASSRWCLEELVKILECRQNHQQIVIPVFYEIDPSHVRNQSGSFAVAFAQHQKHTCKGSVQRWKDALKEAANLSGFDSHSRDYRNECELIEAIVQDVLKRLNYHLLSTDTSSHLIGIDSKIKHVEQLLCFGSEDVRSVGLCGTGGIGKPTLARARAVFNKISCQFDGSHFIENINEELVHGSGLNRLRQELLSTLLGDDPRNRLDRKKFLIVFNDVFNSRQIKSLIKDFNCFNRQNRIIITIRDKQVLRNCGVDRKYEVEELIHREALELFCKHALGKNQHPTNDYMELADIVTRNTGGVPLALEVFGSHLLGKGKEVWKDVADKLETISNVEIHEKLKISYDELDDDVKKIFFDIGCFFNGSEFDHVKSFLDACGFHTPDGINILINKSLVAISGDKITMHDLIQVMAKEIIRQECPEDPGKRSRSIVASRRHLSCSDK